MISVLDPGVAGAIEASAADIYRRARVDPGRVPSVASLCSTLLGSPPRYVVGMRVEACLVRTFDAWRVWVRAGVSPERARWLVAHEIAEWYYRRVHVHNSVKEGWCDALGAALVAPAPVIREALSVHGLDLPRLARSLKTTQSLVALRYGEVTHCPVALVRSDGASLRGEPRDWPGCLSTRCLVGVASTMAANINDEPGKFRRMLVG